MIHEMQIADRAVGALSDAQQREIAKRLSPLFSRIDLGIPAQRAVALDVKSESLHAQDNPEVQL